MTAAARTGRGCVLAFLSLLIVEHVVVDRLNPQHYMISEYATAGGVGGILGTLALCTWAASFLAAAVLAAMTSDRLLAALLGLAALGVGLAAGFQTQAVRGVLPSGVEITTSGRLHDLGGGLAYLAILASALLSLRRGDSRLFRGATLAVVAAAVILGPVSAAAGIDARGGRQRALVVATCGWQLGLMTLLLRRAASPDMTERGVRTATSH